MSGLLNSYFIEPALRHARRFSTTPEAHDGERAEALQTLRAGAVEEEIGADGGVSLLTERDGVQTERELDSALAGDEVPGLLASMQRGEDASTAMAHEPRAMDEQTDSVVIRDSTGLHASHGALSQSYVADETRTLSSDSVSRAHERGGSSTSTVYSGTLPVNDGMDVLRQKLHEIRDMALSSEEKAKRIHRLMTSDYYAYLARKRENSLTGTSSRRSSRGGTLKGGSRSVLKLTSMDIPDAESLELRRKYNVKAADLRPSLRPAAMTQDEVDSPDGQAADDKIEEEELEFGCKHYSRNVKVQCSDCRHWHTCRHCHDEAEDHFLARKRIENMLCMFCGLPQPAGEFCRGCDETAALYYCDKCKLWDNDPLSRIYHCDDCGICRRGEGLGKDFVHCKKCNVCISIRWAETHRCVERATDCDCPICGDYMFTSSKSVVAMKCGHYIHRNCYDAYMQRSYKCPICSRSAVNMELQWRKLDHAIEYQPMPEQYQSSTAVIGCNDCNVRSETRYHWLGLKCHTCGSYNTQELQVANLPEASNIDTQPLEVSETTTAGLGETGTNPPAAEQQSLPNPVDPTHAIQPILDLRAPSPLPDAFAASALEDPNQSGPARPIENQYLHTSGAQVLDSPQTVNTAHDGSPSSNEGLRPNIVSNTSPSVRPTQPPERYFDGDNSPFWGDSISPTALLTRIGSPVLSRIGSPVWSSPRMFGSNSAGQGESGESSKPKARAESEDDDEEYFIDEDGSGGFGWGISPGAWGISPPAFFAERFLGRSKVSGQSGSNTDADDAAEGTSMSVAMSEETSGSESGSEEENEVEETEKDEEDMFSQLRGHR